MLLKVNVKRFRFLTLLALQLACTSLTDKGDELYEKGLYLESEKTYNQALQKDANDTKALSGLQKARVQIIDVGLIEVRMLRLANNYLLAADKLEITVHNESTRFESSVTGTIANQAYSSNHQDSTQNSSESHNENNQKVGLFPLKAKLMDVKNWFAQQDAKAATHFQSDLNRTWSEHFCPMITEAHQSKGEKSGQWELIERCGRVENHNQIVDTFYRTRFHLSYSEFWSLLKDEKADFKSAKN